MCKDSIFGISWVVFLLRALLRHQHCNDDAILFLLCLFAFSRVMSKDSVSKGVVVLRVCVGVYLPTSVK